MICDNIFKTFIEIVVKQGVFAPDELARDAQALTDKAATEILASKRVDRRVPWLARVSGKGAPGYPEWENVSLMEHLVSVARGAVVFAELDLRSCDENLSEAELEKRLARIVATGFLHDIDKILELDRSSRFNADDVASITTRFRIDTFLEAFDAAAPALWFQAMIDRAETSRSGRVASGGLMLGVADLGDAQYVRLADRMESILLRDSPQAALEELPQFTGLRTDVLQRGWKLIDIQQPLFPFLLDALLTEISGAASFICGMPPLFEMHHDGRMIAAVPLGKEARIVEMALAGVQRRFRGSVRVTVNTRCSIDIHDARATPGDLLEAVEDARLRQRSFALNAQKITSDEGLRQVIEGAAHASGFAIAWPSPDKVSGATLSPLPADDDERNIEAFRLGAALSIGLRCAKPADKDLAKMTLPVETREAQLRAVAEELDLQIPEEILALDHEIMRQSILALLIGGFAASDEELRDALFGDEGLVAKWLDGEGEVAGINARIAADESEAYIAPVREMAEAALHGYFVESDEDAPYRCHFTNRPALAHEVYGSTTEGIYGLKVSAFSGRQNRPESHLSSSAKGTWLSPLARAEHNLRFRLAPRANDKTQMLISSPATSGLFASLTIGNVHDEIEVSAFEACTEDAKKVKIPTIGVDRFSRRLRIARFETMPTNMVDALDLLSRLIKTSIRTCRPLHVFQGLPHPVRDRVFFDALPHEIERGLGKSGFRIEELPGVVHALETWRDVANTNGLGVKLATDVMNPATRLSALCEAVLRIERMDSSDLSPLKGTLSNQVKDMIMDDMENPLVRYARAMTGYQRSTTYNDSQSVRERGMRKAIETVTHAHGLGPMTRETIISAIIAQISNVAERESDKKFPRRQEGEPTHGDALARAAEIFADEVWPRVFQGRLPDSRSRMHAIGVYRAAFDRAHQMRRAGEIVFPFS